jgi:hypothetical protein
VSSSNKTAPTFSLNAHSCGPPSFPPSRAFVLAWCASQCVHTPLCCRAGALAGSWRKRTGRGSWWPKSHPQRLSSDGVREAPTVSRMYSFSKQPTTAYHVCLGALLESGYRGMTCKDPFIIAITTAGTTSGPSRQIKYRVARQEIAHCFGCL